MRFNKIFLVLVAAIIAIGVYQFTTAPSRPPVNAETAAATAAINKVIQDGNPNANGLDATAQAANDAVSAGMNKLNQSASANLTSQPEASITQVLSSNSQFQTFSKLLQSAGLSSVLNGVGPFTVFAPTDAAFSKMSPETLANLQAPGNGEALNQFIGAYIVNATVSSQEMATQTQINGNITSTPLQVSNAGSSISVNGAKLSQTDVAANNGIIHVIDSVFTTASAETPTN